MRITVSRIQTTVIRTLLIYLYTAFGVLRSPARIFVQRNASSYTGIVALTARARRRRFVYSSANVIDFDFGSLERRWNVWLFHLGIRLANQIVVQTAEQQQLCRERFGRDSVVIRSIAEPAERRTARPDAFLWVGRLVGYKRPLDYVELARAVPEAHFRMIAVVSQVSSPTVARQLEQAAEELDNFELLEPRSRADLVPLIETAVAMVNTAEYEGMPNVFLESWARGVPALALSHDPDGVIEREGLGEYAAGSAERLASLAREMWAARDDQRAVADRCQSYVEREHSLDAAAERWAAALGLSQRESGHASA